MAQNPDHVSMALFCDFENVALGVRDANYDKFDIKRVLEKLLLKGSIVVKKAYCDWERYKGFKATMHEANFELIEIPHVRQSGKNSADIRMVVDALDLCYTKAHVNTFVIISGDSDFSPLVSKLRENAKQVIGVGVKQSTSDLLIANCDEFIFYDDLVRDSQRRQQARGNDSNEGRDNNNANREPQQRRSPEEERKRRDEMAKRRAKAIDIAYETFDALISERGDGGKMWASVLKEAIKRRNPGFNENYYGFRTFGNLLEEAQAKGLIAFGRDEKSGAYVYRPSAEAQAQAQAQMAAPAQLNVVEASADPAFEATPAEAPVAEQRRGRRAPSRRSETPAPASERASTAVSTPVDTDALTQEPPAPAITAASEPDSSAAAPRRSRSGGRSGGRTDTRASQGSEENTPAETEPARTGRGRSRGGKASAAASEGASAAQAQAQTPAITPVPTPAPAAAEPATAAPSAGRPRQRRSNTTTGTRRKADA